MTGSKLARIFCRTLVMLLLVVNTAVADSAATDPNSRPTLLDFFNPFAKVPSGSDQDQSKPAKRTLNKKNNDDGFFSAGGSWFQQSFQQQKTAIAGSWFAKPQSAWVNTQYIDLRRNPHRTSEAFYIAEQNERILLIGSEAGWIKIQSSDGTQAWAESRYLLNRLRFTPLADTSNKQPVSPLPSSSISATPWEISLGSGDFGHDLFNQASLSYALSPYFSVAFSAADVFNRVDDSFFIETSLRYYPALGWQVLPYFRLGAGRLFHADAWVSPAPATDSSSLLSVGLGLDYPLSPQIRLRLDASNYHSDLGNQTFTSLPAYSVALAFLPEHADVLALEQALQRPLPHNNTRLGVLAGVYRPQNTGAQPVSGLYLDYLLNEAQFVEGSWGNTKLDNNALATDALSYYQLSLGQVIFRKDFFVAGQQGRSQSNLVVGLGDTRFAGQTHATLQLALEQTAQVNDLWSLQARVSDHIFNYALSENSKITHTPEATVGLALHF